MSTIKRIGASAFAIMLLTGGLAQAPVVRADEPSPQAPLEFKVNQASENVAIGGYDLVAYFTEKDAVKGSSAYAVEWGGTIYRFASEEHQAAFLSDPGKYLPRFGGYCPVALKEGRFEKGNPEEFVVQNGRLYICENASAHAELKDNPEAVVEAAEDNVSEVIREQMAQQK